MKKTEESSKHLNKYLSNFLIDQKVAGNSPRTIQFYSQNVSRFIEWLEKEHGGADLSLIDLRNIKLYTLHLKESLKYDANKKQETNELLSDKTVQTYVRAVKSFISYLGKESFIEEGLASKIKLPKATVKQVEILTEEEIRTIAELLKKKKTNHYRDLAIFYIFIECGVRLNEVVGLKLTSINFKQCILKVLGKGNKERYIQFGVNVQKMLMKYVQFERPVPMNKRIENVFLKDDGTEIQKTTVVNLFRRIKKWTGIDKLHVHLCRHTMITLSLANGENAFLVKSKTGHSSFDIMNNYFHLADTIKNGKSGNNNSLLDNMNIR